MRNRALDRRFLTRRDALAGHKSSNPDEQVYGSGSNSRICDPAASPDGPLRTANRNIQHIRYGNTTPNRDFSNWSVSSAFTLPDDTWKFSVMFDYGEYNVDFPQISDGQRESGSVVVHALNLFQITTPASRCARIAWVSVFSWFTISPTSSESQTTWSHRRTVRTI